MTVPAGSIRNRRAVSAVREHMRTRLPSLLSLALVLTGGLLLGGCFGSSSSHGGRSVHVITIHGRPRHWVTLHSQSRTYAPGSLAPPLTVACPDGGLAGNGVKEVIRSWRPGTRTLYGGSIEFDVSRTGAIHVSC